MTACRDLRLPATWSNTLGFKKVCVIDDSSSYGAGLADAVKPVLGDAADTSCSGQVKAGDKDFSATVQLVNGAAPDAVFYAGYYAEAAPFVAAIAGCRRHRCVRLR